MRTLCEASWETDEELKEGEPVIKKGKFFLLHFGLKCDLIETENKRMVAMNYTVAICQDCKTGQIREFLPTQLKIIGDEIKK